MDSFFKLLDDLIRPGNWPFLAVFTLVLLLGVVVLVFVVVAIFKKDKLNLSHKFGPLWVHLSGGPDDPKVVKSLLRKLLYVKVNLLANRKTQPTPFYNRVVDRLDASDRSVPVYDEAVFYTLKLFPQMRVQSAEQDQSRGVVDARLVVPWLKTLDPHSAEIGADPHAVDMESAMPTDTMCSVSHFLNALQGSTQSFCTYADDDADSLRLVVDFSSIPQAAARIQMDRVRLTDGNASIESDDLKFEQCTDTVFMAHCRNAKKGYLLTMDFTFKDWDAPPA
jgi:hypothetical protein